MKYIEKDFPVDKLNIIAQKEANAKKPIYQIHKWWARRLGSIFRMIILTTFLDYDESKSLEENEEELWEKFYSKMDLGGKIILDPFMGGGTTVVEGIRLGCKVIGVDIHPVAWFITKKEVEPVDLKKLNEAFKEIERKVADKIKRYYKTTCPKCGREADVMYVFWVKKVKCGGCGKEVRLFNNFTIARKSKKNKKKNNEKETIYFVFCPSCGEIFESNSSKVKCLYCDEEFDATKGYATGGKYTCPYCGHKEDILRAVRREGKIPEAEMFAIEYYCDNKSCGRGYKKVDKEDLELFEEAKKEFEKRKQELLGKLIPDQEIPDGYNTKQAKNYLYKYFYEMFNERQLLCLSMLLEEILKIKDENIREFMLLTFSNILDTNNMFCNYHPTYFKLENMFAHHAYWPRNVPLENNVWGTKIGRGTFIKFFEKMKKAKEYCLEPYENLHEGGKVSINNDVIKGILAEDFEDLLNNDKNVLLKAQTAEDLSFIPDKSVDAVITDPPYYDNVMYSELADFFYIWLRIGLKNKYDFFQPEYSPRRREIIKNDAQGKDEKFFLDGLTRVFKECCRVLKDDGLLVFTFHHQETKAWSSVLKTVLDSGFYIVSVYPVHSEIKSPFTTIDKKAIQYDAIIVCRKREETNKTASWERLKDEIYLKAEETVRMLYESGRNLSDADIFVIAVGKCLEVYSKYYPNVFKNGERVDLDKAIDDIEEIVDSLIKKRDRMLLSSGVDEITKLYVFYLVEKDEMSYDELNKRLRTGGIDINIFFNEKLLKKEGNKVILVNPEDRKDYIEEKRRKGKKLAIIDKIHYLYSVYKEGKPLIEYLKDWADENIKQVCKVLYNKTGDEIYSKIAGVITIGGTEKKKIINTTLKDFEI